MEGRMATERAIVVIAEASGVEDAVVDVGLQLDIAGIIGDMRGSRIGVAEPLDLVLGAERQRLAGNKMHDALPIGLFADAMKFGRVVAKGERVGVGV